MREGRLANVAGVVLWRSGATRDAIRMQARRLAWLCEDVLVVGSARELAELSGSAGAVPGRTVPAPDESPLSRLAAALAAASAARVLVVEGSGDAPASPELLLGLVAWPESDAVVPDRGSLARAGASAPLRCGIFRREPALAAARHRLAAGERDFAGLLAQLAAVSLETADLAAIAGTG